MTLGRIVIVGRGRVGQGLHARIRAALKERRGERSVRGVSVRLERARGVGRLRADTVILAVPDASLAHLALRLSGRGRIRPVGRKLPVVLHVSGIRDPSVLRPLADAGLAVGAMHPLASFASAEHPPPLEGVTFAIATRGKKGASARARAVQLAELVGAEPLVGSERSPILGPTYHAAAALLANGAAALAAEASAILAELGLRPKARQRALAGLLRSVAENVAAVGTPHALTGPVMRGDASAVALHLRSIPAARRPAYAAASRVVLEVALEAGLGPHPARAIRRLLDQVPTRIRGGTRK